MKNIYLDYAASIKANPSSIHSAGVEAKNKLEKARLMVASVLGGRKEEIIFTSGGTESNNLAIQGVIWMILEMQNLTPSPLSIYNKWRGVGERWIPHIVTTNIEHPSVLETCKLLGKRGLAEISIVPVEANGIVNPKKIKKEFKKNTVLVSVMYANNEIGTVQPIREIAKEIRHFNKINQRMNQRKILFHTDAVQAANYLDLNVDRLGVDLLSLSGSKIENSGRVGVLYKKRNVALANIFGGGDQEFGFRPGTENLSEILNFSQALNAAQKIKEKEGKRLTVLRDYFVEKLLKLSADLILNGEIEHRLPNNINITFSKIPSDLMVIELSARGVMASPKSACKSSSSEGSYVIKALRPDGPDADLEIGGVRFSLGSDTNKKDIDYTIKALSQILKKLEKWYT